MGLVYLPTWMVDFYGINVGKYTSPMDPMGFICMFYVVDTATNAWKNMSQPKGAFSFFWVYLFFLEITNMTNWKIPMFNRKYILIHGGFSIAMFVFLWGISNVEWLLAMPW